MSLLGIDVGTTGCKAVALSADGKILGIAHREYNVIRPQPGWAELDSRLVWAHILDTIREVVPNTVRDPIVSLSVSSMGEAMTPVSRDGQILGNCLLGFDTRGGDTLEKLSGIDPVTFFARSGTLPTTIYGGPKLVWLKDHRPALFEQAYKFLGWADLVAFLLGGEPVMDFSLANRIMFFDVRRQQWSPETLDFVGMPADKLPELAQAGRPVGTVSDGIAQGLGLLKGVRIVVGAHDQCTSALGAGVIRTGQAAYGLGTYIAIVPTYNTIPPADIMVKARMNVEHHALPGLYISILYNLTGGALLKWFRDNFAPLERAAAQVRGKDVYDELLAEMPAEPTHLMVLPHFAPTGPPYYDEHPIGLIAGLTLETTRGEFIKGLLEGVTYYFRAGLESVAAAGISIQEYRVTGGGARSDAWLQIKADILGKPLIRPRITEAGALGAAILAGLGAGVYASARQAVDALITLDRTFEPDPVRQRQYDERFSKYGLLYPFCRALR